MPSETYWPHADESECFPHPVEATRFSSIRAAAQAAGTEPDDHPRHGWWLCAVHGTWHRMPMRGELRSVAGPIQGRSFSVTVVDDPAEQPEACRRYTPKDECEFCGFPHSAHTKTDELRQGTRHTQGAEGAVRSDKQRLYGFPK